MLRDYLVVLAVNLRRYAHMRTTLASGFVAKALKCLHQIRAAYVARQPYSTSTSSRTKCKRTDAGRGIDGSK